MKRIKITAANAVKKGLVKVGDEVKIEFEIIKMLPVGFVGKTNTGVQCSFTKSIISIPKPEPKPIDFGKEGLILKGEISIVKTTGYCGTECFSGIYLNGNCTKGFTSNGFIKDQNMWQDITETYKP
jgi:hypothetical protein